MSARVALCVAGLLTLSASPPASAGDLREFLASAWPTASAAGVSRALFDATTDGLVADPAVEALAHRQPEFGKPLGAYLAAQVTPARVAQGRRLLGRWATALAATERDTGVPASIVVAVWGLESNFGASAGSKDVIRSMATLGAAGVRPDLYRGELVAALRLLQDGAVTRDQLRGSWAGAMGQPQFMPSSYAAFAADGDGDGRRDIWGDVPDVLASVGAFLRAKGWVAGRPWGMPVTLPRGFDPSQGRAGFATWRARGVVRTDGAPLPESGEGILFFPAGADGPAFLVTENYEVLKSYNFSDAYVLAVADLADRMAGNPAPAGRWPATVGMGRPDRIALQARMAALGYAVDNREGRISLAFRDQVRLAQRRVGLTPDGNPTDTLLRALAGTTSAP